MEFLLYVFHCYPMCNEIYLNCYPIQPHFCMSFKSVLLVHVVDACCTLNACIYILQICTQAKIFATFNKASQMRSKIDYVYHN